MYTDEKGGPTMANHPLCFGLDGVKVGAVFAALSLCACGNQEVVVFLDDMPEEMRTHEVQVTLDGTPQTPKEIRPGKGPYVRLQFAAELKGRIEIKVDALDQGGCKLGSWNDQTSLSLSGFRYLELHPPLKRLTERLCKLQVQVYGSGRVVSDPAGIDCNEGTLDCVAEFASGKEVKLEPLPRYHARWNAPECRGRGSCTLKLDARRTLPMHFSSGACMDNGFCLQMPVPSGHTLHSVWGSEPTNLFMVGDDGVIYHYDGQVYSQLESPTIQHLYGVFGSTKGSIGTQVVYIVGTKGTVLRFDGRTVSAIPSDTTEDLYGVFTDSKGETAWAVGQGGVVLHKVGERFVKVESGITQDLHGIWGSPDGTGEDLRVVGASGGIWRVAEFPLPQKEESKTSATLRAISGLSGRDLFVAGDGKTLLRFDGTSWRTLSGGGNVRLLGVAGREADIFAVGERGTILRALENGTETISPPLGLPQTLNLRSLWSNKGQIFAVGDHGLTLGLSGKTWDVQTPPGVFSSITVSKDGTLWISGEGEVVAFTDSAKPIRLKADRPMALNRVVYLPSTNKVWALGQSGVLAELNLQKGFVPKRFDGQNHLTGAAESAEPGKVWLVGDRGLFGLHDGSGFQMDPGWQRTEDLCDVFASGQEVFVATCAGSIYHRGVAGGAFKEYPMNRRIRRLTGRNERDIWALGPKGMIAHFDGKTFVDYSRNAELDYYDGYADGMQMQVAADTGTLVMYNYEGQVRNQERVTEKFWPSLRGIVQRLQRGKTEIWAVGAEGIVVRKILQ
jgi:hypothetical protein